MFQRVPDAQQRATSLVYEHGIRVRQVIADRIVAAIKSGDLDGAKEWDHVGAHADRLLNERAKLTA